MPTLFETHNKVFDYGFPAVLACLYSLFILFEVFRPSFPLFYKWRFRLNRITAFLSLALIKGFQAMVRHFAFAASWNINKETEETSMNNLLFGYDMRLPIVLNLFFIAFGCLFFGIVSKFVRSLKWVLLSCVVFQFLSAYLMAFLVQRGENHLVVYILHIILSTMYGMFEGLTQVCIYKFCILWYEQKREYAILSVYIGTELLFELWFGLELNTIIFELTHKVETMLYVSATLLMLSTLGITLLKERPSLVDDTHYYVHMADRYLRWKVNFEAGNAASHELADVFDEELKHEEDSEGFVKMSGNTDEIDEPHILSSPPTPPTPADEIPSHTNGEHVHDEHELDEHHHFPDLYDKEQADMRSFHLVDVLSNAQLWILCMACFVSGALRDQMRATIIRVQDHADGLWAPIALQFLSLIGYAAIITSLVVHIFIFSGKRAGQVFNPSTVMFVASVFCLVGRAVFLFASEHVLIVGIACLMLSFFGRIIIDCALSFAIFDIAGGYKYIGLTAGLMWGSFHLGLVSNVFLYDVAFPSTSRLMDEIMFVIFDVILVAIFVVSMTIRCCTKPKAKAADIALLWSPEAQMTKK
uniref:Uncharacterized protein n=1 Tax=Percolomonas cosmopolitus TaxID=63605 RepID=A0A7S1PK47_9EUKA